MGSRSPLTNLKSWYGKCSYSEYVWSEARITPAGTAVFDLSPNPRRFTMAASGTLHDAFIDELRDTYDAERQLTKALAKLAKAATSPTL